MSAKTAAVLREARALIEDETHWIKGSGFMVVDGVECYCAIGATSVASGDEHEVDSAAYGALLDAVPGEATGVSIFNDDPSTTHADVLALFDRAIATEEASA